MKLRLCSTNAALASFFRGPMCFYCCPLFCPLTHPLEANPIMQISTLPRRFALPLLAGLFLAANMPVVQAQDLATSLAPILNSPVRSAENKARDQYRHPVETLKFFGVHPAAQLIEITPGAGGWYAEILAPLLKEKGVYIAANVNPVGLSERGAEYNKKANEKQKAKFTANPDAFGKVASLEFTPKTPNFGPNNSADFVLTFRNAHNWVMGGNHEAMFKAAYDVLKPGGVFGVVDHRAAEGKSLEEVMKSGYLPQAFVISLAEKVGFTLDAKSEVNANPKDTKDYADGVWTLPPSFALGQKDREKFAAIGESDRMTLRFVKKMHAK